MWFQLATVQMRSPIRTRARGNGFVPVAILVDISKVAYVRNEIVLMYTSKNLTYNKDEKQHARKTVITYFFWIFSHVVLLEISHELAILLLVLSCVGPKRFAFPKSDIFWPIYIRVLCEVFAMCGTSFFEFFFCSEDILFEFSRRTWRWGSETFVLAVTCAREHVGNVRCCVVEFT